MIIHLLNIYSFIYLFICRGFSLKLEGHLADILLNILTKIFTAFSRDRVITNIEIRFEESLQAKIKEFNDGVLEPIPPNPDNNTNKTQCFY